MKLVSPSVTEMSAAFWQGGSRGQLLIARCQRCRFWIHPPQPVCPACRGTEVGREAVSGQGTVWSWTLNRYRWVPELEPPYVIAEIELDEQPGLRVLSTVRGDGEVEIGQRVHVEFEPLGNGTYAPVFVA